MRWIAAFTLVVIGLTAPVLAQDNYWCLNGGDVHATVDGSSVTIHHDGAFYNCCPDPFEYDVFWEDGTLVVVENEILTNPCYCMCCFNLSATIDDVPPGDWTVLFQWGDHEVELSISVADGDPAGDAVAGAVWKSDCLSSPSPVPDEPAPFFQAWGAIKSWYR